MGHHLQYNERNTGIGFKGSRAIAAAFETPSSKKLSVPQSTVAGIAIIDDNLRYIEVNETLAKFNGLTVEEHVGRTVAEVLPSIAHLVEPECRKVLSTGEPLLNCEITGGSPGNTDILGRWTISLIPIPGEDGKPNGLGAVVFETGFGHASFDSARDTNESSRFTESQHVKILDDKMKLLKDVSVALSTAAEVLEQARRSGLSVDLNMTNGVDFKDEVRRFEILLIEKALKESGGNQKKAAKLLHLKHTTLHTKIKRYEILCEH